VFDWARQSDRRLFDGIEAPRFSNRLYRVVTQIRAGAAGHESGKAFVRNGSHQDRHLAIQLLIARSSS